jgi:cytoskeletal protein CcmA (bactofilin family)
LPFKIGYSTQIFRRRILAGSTARDDEEFAFQQKTINVSAHEVLTMFSRKKSHVPQKQIDSLIGASTTIDGNVEFVGGLRVDGRVRGNIISQSGAPGTLVLSEKSHVEGEIRVSHVVVDGTVKGPVTATEYLELLPNARITGDVTYKTLEMQVGAVVDGRLLHVQQGTAEVVELKRISGGSTVSG